MQKIVGFIAMFSLLLAFYLTFKIQMIEKTNTTELAGVIRNAGDGWYSIEDEGHESIGVSDVSSNEDGIIITYTQPVSKIHTFIATPDEKMSKDGLLVGVSAGLDKAHIYIYDREGYKVNPLKYYEPSSNIWLYAKFIK